MIYLFLAGGTKQFPLAYVLMTRRRTCDYVAVFERINQILGFPDVVEVISDFEKAIWSAVRVVYPEAKHLGCAFHWAQAIMKKVCPGLEIIYHLTLCNIYVFV